MLAIRLGFGHLGGVTAGVYSGSRWAESLARGSSTIADGRATLAGNRLLGALADIDTFLSDVGVDSDQPLVFDCANTLADALTLLALLVRGSSFVLQPAQTPGTTGELPQFFAHRIWIRGSDATHQDQEDGFADPQTFLSHCSIEGPSPAGLPDASLARERVFLRTSGSLGAAKLVVHTHDRLLENARNGIERLGVSSADRVLIPVPLAHMYGLGAGFLPAMLAGASVSLLAGANLLTFLAREREYKPTIAFLTPNLCATLLRPRDSTRGYRHVVVAGDKLSPELFGRTSAIFNRVLNLYGSTEMGIVCAAEAGSDEGPREASVGRPLPGVELRVSPSEATRDEPESGARGRDVGELHCAHPHGFEGYVDGSGRLQAAEPWYDTRDLARILPGGHVELLGRSDHAVKRDGRLVMLAELERALEQLPGVARAAAVVFGQTLRGRGIVGFCVPAADASLDPQQLRRACQAILPAHAVPDELRVLAAMPLLPSGKLDRVALQSTLTPLEPPNPASNQHG